MQTAAELDRSAHLDRDIFSADEIGWVGADAEVQAVLLGTKAGPLADAHARIDALGRVAAHPRLVRAVEGRLGHAATIEASAYWRSWDGSVPLLPDGAGQVAVVFLGWRGKVGGFAAELGAVVLADAAEAAGFAAAGGVPAGPFLAVRYGRDGASIPALGENCLWPSAWCV